MNYPKYISVQMINDTCRHTLRLKLEVSQENKLTNYAYQTNGCNILKEDIKKIFDKILNLNISSIDSILENEISLHKLHHYKFIKGNIDQSISNYFYIYRDIV